MFAADEKEQIQGEGSKSGAAAEQPHTEQVEQNRPKKVQPRSLVNVKLLDRRFRGRGSGRKRPGEQGVVPGPFVL